MEVIEIHENGSVLIDTNLGFTVWVDVWKQEGEIFADWNKYIFFLNCSEDIQIKNFQENTANYEICAGLAIDYYIMYKK